MTEEEQKVKKAIGEFLASLLSDEEYLKKLEREEYLRKLYEEDDEDDEEFW